MLSPYNNIPILLYCFIIYYGKTTKFDWTTDYNTVFNQLKHALVHAPVLAMPNFYANFVVETNASNMAVGAVLMQHDWPVAFMLKALDSVQYNYHTMDCELLAIVLSCKRMVSLSGWQKDCCIDRSQTSYRNPHSTRLEQKRSQVV